ncbi:phage tail tape measure protein [Ancylobacter pratisalsi]|uniref:Phage tail tape measure protein domain-containing protein n=1 Tax=Ancylobacter pratisalsi TaxID=1745854 RepID=A0A6P1YST9_9HYPH|nr:phage tail tape measure protein [Ancylobacter pratisalsi]QIB34744.1 hypothetical protein G3A50_14290 [Ancylobacter pratisalsi]
MAGRTMDLSILVRLVDRLTGPLGALQRKFAQFAQLGQRIGILGAAAAAISFAAPIMSAAAFDQQLRDIVVTAGKVGPAAEDRIRQLAAGYSELALQIGIASSEIAAAGGLLIASGMDDALTNRLLPTIGRVSKAASAATGDVAKVAFALNNSLGVTADEMEVAFAKLITAGKLGRFEFRDMARELPELASQFTKFKIQGLDAVETLGASLQVAMFGTDNTSAAANNFKNYLSKVLSPDAVKNFKEFGVDIEGVMKNAAAKGINPIEASIQKVLSLTGVSQEKALAFFKTAKDGGMTDVQAAAAAVEQIRAIGATGKLTNIFGDMQVLDFLLPMLANIDKYKEFKKEIAGAGLDVIAQDYATQWNGLQTQMTIAQEIATQATRRIGLGFAQNLPWINEWGKAALGWVREIDATYPGAIDTVLGLTGAFLAGIAGLAIMVPALTILSAAFGVLAGIVGFVLSPIGLVVAALAGLAYLIYADWATFGPFFTYMWGEVKQAFSDGVDAVTRLFAGDWVGAGAAGRRILAALGNIGRSAMAVLRGALRPVLAWLDDALGGIPSKLLRIGAGIATAIGSFATTIWDRVSSTFSGDRSPIIDWLLGGLGALGSMLLSAVTSGIDFLANLEDDDWRTLGERFGNALVDALKAPFGPLMTWFTDLPGRILAAIGSIDVSSLISWPSLPSWLGGGSAAPANDNAPGTAPAAAPSAQPQRQGFAVPPGGFASPASMPAAGRSQVGGQIVVSAAPGTKVESVKSANADVPLKADNGRMVGRI